MQMGSPKEHTVEEAARLYENHKRSQARWYRKYRNEISERRKAKYGMMAFQHKWDRFIQDWNFIPRQ